MKRYLFSFIFALLTMAVSSQGMIQHYGLTVGEFSRLKVVKGINVDYRCSSDSAGMVVFSSTPEMASVIGFRPSGNELTIDFTTDQAPREGLPTITVYSSFLTHVSNAGDSTVRILSVAPCPEFRARQEGNGRVVVRDVEATRVSAKLTTGNGQVIVYGRCEDASLSMVGTGLIQADGLMARNVKIVAAGTGQVGCWATDLLKVTGAGSTRVFYRGHPTIKKTWAVGVKVEPMQ